MRLNAVFFLLILPFLTLGSSDLHAFDTTQIYVIHSIRIEGNEKTRMGIMLRELTFQAGDSVFGNQIVEQIQKSRENLINTSLFHFVEIKIAEEIPKNLVILIVVKERWYTWPVPLIFFEERNLNTWLETKSFDKLTYGMMVAQNNFRGRKETIGCMVLLGFDERFDILYEIPFLNKNKTLGINFSAGYSQSHTIQIITFENKPVYLKSYDDYVKKNYYGKFNLQYRKGLYNFHNFQLSYSFLGLSDTVIEINPNYLSNAVNTVSYSGFNYRFKHDKRNIKYYTTKGHYFDIEFTKYGMGLFNKNSVDMFELKSNTRKYWTLNDRLFFAQGLTVKIADGKQIPYFLNKSLGYGRDFVRAYEYYVVDGQFFILSKSNLKYQLLKTRIKKIGSIKSEKFNTIPYSFYLNLSYDAGYVKDRLNYKNNSLANQYLHGYGIGIDFVTYYDKVFRLDYSINKQGEKGIFIHFIAPI